MKKARRILCLMAVLALCLSLCGCSMLEDVRASRAVYTKDGEIELNGALYKLLPQCEELTPTFSEYTELYAVESEVPLLLTSMMGDYLDISDDGVFLSNYMDVGTVYYCRSDAYDAVYDRIVNGYEADTCAYWSYDFNTGKEISMVLTRQQLDAVWQVLETQEPQIMPAGASMRWDYRIYLYMCSDDLLFRTPMVDICVASGLYYVVAEANGVSAMYSVPAELVTIFVQIAQEYMQYEDAYYGEW
ncbi:MAG: hypothetical protein IJO72_05995 [Oscillospiraceae bacterium]|nr:hypothetical protein [Oscillospiraceae bacterium]